MSSTWLSSLSRRPHRSIGVALLLVAGLTAIGCKDKSSTAAAPARTVPSVTVASVELQDVPIYIEEIGKMKSIEVVDVTPQVDGKIISAPVEEGAYVKKGDLLFQIDKRPYQAKLDAAEASLAQAKAQQRFAQVEFERIQKLAKTDVASQLEYDQTESDLQVAEARIAAAQADIESARLNLEYTTITSPIDGRVGARLVDAGNVVRANQGTLITIQRIDPIYAQFTITESDLSTVRQYLAAGAKGESVSAETGLGVQVEIPAASQRLTSALAGLAPAGASDAETSGLREGTLSFLDSAVQSDTGTVMLRATMPNSDHYFWPGQFVNVRLILTHKTGAVLVPSQAVRISQQGSYVYVITKGTDEKNEPIDTAEIRLVSTGQQQPDGKVVINSGVKPGEQVVVSGQMMIMPGGPVRIAQDTAALPPTTQPVADAR